MIEVDCDSSLPAVWADHDRLEQVFVNLLDNALGHNPPGTRVSVSAQAAGRDGISVTVLDNGTGMPREIASAPFEPMRRRRTPGAGAGLGLSIAKGIVEAHGGNIVLEQPGKGTHFLIHLPVEMPPGPDGPPAAAAEPEAAAAGPAAGGGHDAGAGAGRRTGARGV
jgi:signal transduction histidine kinase